MAGVEAARNSHSPVVASNVNSIASDGQQRSQPEKSECGAEKRSEEGLSVEIKLEISILIRKPQEATEYNAITGTSVRESVILLLNKLNHNVKIRTRPNSTCLHASLGGRGACPCYLALSSDRRKEAGCTMHGACLAALRST